MQQDKDKQSSSDDDRDGNSGGGGAHDEPVLGLMLAGGAVRGAFQAGVVAALARAGARFRVVCGTSVGAVNGAGFLLGYGPDLPAMWRDSLREVRWFDWRRVARARSPFLISEAMRIMAERYGDPERLASHPTEMLISTTAWRTGLNVLFSSKDDGAGWTEEERVAMVMASLTIPLVCTERIVIRGVRYCDGALSDNMPLAALAQRGARRIVVVDPSPGPPGAARRRLLSGMALPLRGLPLAGARLAAGLLACLGSAPPAPPPGAALEVVTPPPTLAARSLDFRSLEAVDRMLAAGEEAGAALVARLRTSGWLADAHPAPTAAPF